MKLYELNNQIEEFRLLVESGDIPEEAIADTLESMEMNWEEKIDNVASFFKSLIAEGKAIREEEKALAERRKVKENRADSLKEYIQSSMLTVGKAKVETSRNVLSFRNSKSVALSADFIESLSEEERELYTKTAVSANKTAIKNALTDGVELDGASIEERQNLQVK